MKALLGKARNQLTRVRSEGALWWASFRLNRERRTVLFFPSAELAGASLLRAQMIATALDKLGWNAAVVPSVTRLAGRARIIRRFRPDLLVFQQCRHVLNDGDFSFGVPYVVDTDDADFHLELPGLAERLERTVRGARGVIAGSRYLRDHHCRLNSNVAVIWTGTRHRLRFYGVDREADRAALVSHFGPDAQLELLPTLSYDEFLLSLREVALGLCPLIFQSAFSRGKSFGKILAYLDAGVPVIASDMGDHSLFFTADAGVVTNDPEEWEKAAIALLADPIARDRMAEHATAFFRERLTIESAARLTDQFLRKLV